jgi:hypothetical protein
MHQHVKTRTADAQPMRFIVEWSCPTSQGSSLS